MRTPSWQIYLFTIETIITLPFYTTLIVSLIVWRRRNNVFRSPYYTITLAQVLPDFLIVATYLLLWMARFFHIGNEFVFKYQDYFFADYIMIQSTLLLIMKAFAVAAIAIQRYISLCCHTSWLHQPDLLIAYMHPNYPVIMSTFAFINPWTLLILNSDVRRNLFGSSNTNFLETSSRPAVQAIRVGTVITQSVTP
ncbi:unnamed protein product [Caenorhabditis auriculariae]|uniref:Serpentine receptor class gamma n=1 Tax=Caenorhabditis auriculariae TaxID=2777116 RepID=A0A8S1HJT3_9PELO|nr:unnamed protein product [Caenorhabditis auriculariae]